MKTKPSSIDEIRQQTRELIEAHEKGIQDFHKNHFSHLCKRERRMARLEIVDYLRSYAGGALELVAHKRADEAADEITRLREENARLREALKPFAYYASQIPNDVSDTASASGTVGDLRAAAAAIREGGKDEN